MVMNTIIRFGYPIIFGILLASSIIELSISAWLTSKFNTMHNNSSTSEKISVRYILFCSVWTIVFGGAYFITFLLAISGIITSIASHTLFLFVTWILWLAAAAAITSNLGGSLNCKVNTAFFYCEHLNALMGFAWLIFILLTIILILVLIRGIISAKRGDGYRGALLDV
ncbi:hypothetical protein CPB84DRAFT_1805999 [Gymnopilus junonius]|uniref:MARVEL domain-containing protein n=1 Tax=Gymnopilus junonius TaxID=109634 RepID=A0A9P5N786_GYMJU|nr:hypothetical protein CPB84DRAFT_1805999 [Gymnopilus junonius]